MATLQGRAIKDTFKDLLQVSNGNNGVDPTLRSIEDGEGTTSALALSQTEVRINGDLDVTGDVTGVPHVDYKGAYVSGTSYIKDDVVTYLGSSYINTSPSTGIAPTSTLNWGLLASKGTDGTDGADGSTGPAGPAGGVGADGADGADGTDFPITPNTYSGSSINTPTVITSFGMSSHTPNVLSYSVIQIVGRQVFATGSMSFTSGSYPQVQNPSTTLGSGIQISLPTINNVLLEAGLVDVVGMPVVVSSSASSQGSGWANWYKPETAIARAWGGSPNSIKIEFPQSTFMNKYIAMVNFNFSYLLNSNVTLP